jgi:hypothetical protein
MRLLDRERINNMSELEKLKMIDNIKTSNLTIQEKDANLELLQPSYEKQEQVMRDFKEGQADIDDLKGN